MADPVRSPLSGREILARGFRQILLAVILISGAIYLLDYAVLRYRIATDKTPFGTVTVRVYYAVPRKDQKTEFLVGDPQEQTCVHSLLPHMGDLPCWYLATHKEQRVNM